MFITDDDIRNFIYENLIKHGCVPEERELEIICQVFFDYLKELGILVDFMDLFDEEEGE
ncbi:YozD family protein [Ornithinibacillus xuwenensis]|jgi:hypothetical protein|uniref:YozD family protein n=1 Tax=Ornithinibacillus xuwenensis TaxID=3144668 RepID=A0ABU9XDE4_9BACI